MTAPQIDPLMYRVAELEKSNRRWKWLALVSLACLSAILVLAAGSATVLWRKAQAERARAEQALYEAEEQRDRAEQVRRFLEDHINAEAPPQ